MRFIIILILAAGTSFAVWHYKIAKPDTFSFKTPKGYTAPVAFVHHSWEERIPTEAALSEAALAAPTKIPQPTPVVESTKSVPAAKVVKAFRSHHKKSRKHFYAKQKSRASSIARR